MRSANFENMLAVLRREQPTRPTPFELFLGDHVLEHFTNRKSPGYESGNQYQEFIVDGYLAAGYDFATVRASDFLFETASQEAEETISLNKGLIFDENSFEKYNWRNPEDYSCNRLDQLEKHLSKGAKLIVVGPGGVLENVMSIVGYDNLCYMLYDEPELLKSIFDEVGKRILKYYEMVVEHKSVGAILVNDDWGFNTQTFLSSDDMRHYVFPWHQKYVELAHSIGKPAILHSCGYFDNTIDDVVNMGYDGKHSYEDNIRPVEQAYDLWKDKIAILGGIDMNFLATQDDESIYRRCCNMLSQTNSQGYAIGSGNSIASYVPLNAFLSMKKSWC